jgi:hypothetical protein
VSSLLIDLAVLQNSACMQSHLALLCAPLHAWFAGWIGGGGRNVPPPPPPPPPTPPGPRTCVADVPEAVPAASALPFKFDAAAAVSPSGSVVSADSRSLLLDGEVGWLAPTPTAPRHSHSALVGVCASLLAPIWMQFVRTVSCAFVHTARSLVLWPCLFLCLSFAQRWYPVSGEIHLARVPSAMWREQLLRMKSGGLTMVAVYVFWIHHEEAKGVFNFTGRRDIRSFISIAADVGLKVSKAYWNLASCVGVRVSACVSTC